MSLAEPIVASPLIDRFEYERNTSDLAAARQFHAGRQDMHERQSAVANATPSQQHTRPGDKHSPNERMRPPFHVFEYRSERFVVDVGSHSILRISDDAFRYLTLLENGEDDDTAVSVTAAEFGVDTARRIVNEVEQLVRDGHFRQEVAATDKTSESIIDQLLQHSSRAIMFLVTEACNLHCTYCYEVASKFHDAARKMTRENADKVLAEFFSRNKRRGQIKFTFFGGEPLLNFDIIKYVVTQASIIGAKRNQKVLFSITTNGTMMTNEIADYLVQNRFTVMASLDGSRENNDRYRVDRSGRGTHDAAIAGIRLLLEKQLAAGQLPLKIRATMTRENADTQNVEAYLRSIGPVRTMIGSSVGTASSKSRWDVPDRDVQHSDPVFEARIDEFLNSVSQDTAPPINSPLVEALAELDAFIGTKRPSDIAVPKLCGVGRNMLAATPDGTYYPCHRYVGMENWKLGSIQEGGPRTEKLRNYYGQLFSGFLRHCTKCWMRFRCGGQCPWYLSTPKGSIVEPDSGSCNAIRRNEEILLWLYAKVMEISEPWFLKYILRKTNDNQLKSECGKCGSEQVAPRS